MATREFIIPGNHQETLCYAAEHFITSAQKAIQDHDAFYVALSGGSTPKAVYSLLTTPPYCEEIEWNKVHLFWSDERAVCLTDKESNYHMAMEAGFKQMPLASPHIHPMIADQEIEKNALSYERTLRRILEDRVFDLILLGVGEDGHTASLFPGTQALEITDRWVAANYIPEKKSWRMTLTFPCLNEAAATVFYVLGKSKQKIVTTVFKEKNHLPCQFVGTEESPSLWILDDQAAEGLKRK